MCAVCVSAPGRGRECGEEPTSADFLWGVFDLVGVHITARVMWTFPIGGGNFQQPGPLSKAP